MPRTRDCLAVLGVAFGALVLPAAASAEPAHFEVGTAVVDITPDAEHPQYLGGYDRMDQPTSNAHDPVEARAFFVAHGSSADAFVIVDSQGWFAGYQEGPFGVTDARQQAADWLS